MEVKIMALEINNFKGLKHFKLEPAGHNILIKANNAVGKTTLADAFYWVLFDKDSTGKSQFEIKTLDKAGEPMHGVEHSAELTLNLGQFHAVKLKKIYKEKWVQQKGQSKKHFSGHEIKYYVDDVPVKKMEYDKKIAEIIPDENVFKLLTGVYHFNEQLHWQERRDLLLEVCGDVPDSEVINSSDKLRELPDIIGNKTAEQHKRQIKEKQKKVNEELKQIPVRIDEVNRSVQEIPEGADKKQLEADIKELEKQIAEKQKGMTAGEQLSKLKVQLNEAIAEKSMISSRIRQERQPEVDAIQQDLHGLKSEKIGHESGLQNSRQAIERLKDKQEYYNEEIKKLREKWHEVNGREASFEEICAYCGQKMPVDKIKEAKEQFNLDKATELEEISKKGKQLKSQLEAVNGEIKKQQQQIGEGQKAIEDLTEAIQACQATIEAKEKEIINQIESEQSKQVALIETLQNQINSQQPDTSHIEQEIEAIKQQIGKKTAILIALDKQAGSQKRIEELKQEEKQLAAEYERLQEELDLCDEFIRQKVNLLEEKINNKFEHARFKLFDHYISGGLEESCETLYNGIPYRNLNSGHQIMIGLDIIKTLAEHYETEAPIWIDNAETISEEFIPEMQQQVILLVKPEIRTKKDQQLYNKLQVETY